MAQKKSVFILVTALIMMAFVTVGCERSYAPIEEGQATPTLDGEFPEPLPSDMEGLLETGAQTAAAIAATELEAQVESSAEETAVPEEDDVDVEITPDAGEASSTESPTDPTATPAVAANTLPVIATTAVAPPTSVVGRPPSYTLQKGEFPYCIARRFNIDPGELLALNNLTIAQAQNLQPGLTLSIPQSGAVFPPPRARNTHPASYTVPQNTTVYGVACYFGDVDPAKIMSKNTNVTDPNNIVAGTVLQIP